MRMKNDDIVGHLRHVGVQEPDDGQEHAEPSNCAATNATTEPSEDPICQCDHRVQPLRSDV